MFVPSDLARIPRAVCQDVLQDLKRTDVQMFANYVPFNDTVTVNVWLEIRTDRYVHSGYRTHDQTFTAGDLAGIDAESRIRVYLYTALYLLDERPD